MKLITGVKLAIVGCMVGIIDEVLSVIIFMFHLVHTNVLFTIFYWTQPLFYLGLSIFFFLLYKHANRDVLAIIKNMAFILAITSMLCGVYNTIFFIRETYSFLILINTTMLAIFFHFLIKNQKKENDIMWEKTNHFAFRCIILYEIFKIVVFFNIFHNLINPRAIEPFVAILFKLGLILYFGRMNDRTNNKEVLKNG